MAEPSRPHAPSRPARTEPKPTFGQRVWTEVRGYAEALVIAFLVVTFVFNTVGVVGSSMRPNLNGGVGSSNLLQSLLTGDRVFIPKYETWLRRAGLLGPYRRGDIVVVRDPANSPTALETDTRPFFIKRVVAIPGDHLRIEAGRVVVNGHPIDQGFIEGTGEITADRQDFPVITTQDGELEGLVVRFATTPSGTPAPDLPVAGFYPPALPIEDPRVELYYGLTLDSLAPLPADAADRVPFVHDLILPEDHYFLMGDNRQRARGGSEDSRLFGPVPLMSIAGKASAIIWPPRRDGEWNWRALRPPAAFAEVPAPPEMDGR
ncbi:MAG: signal peptidase I [Trueperaceae bacterium]